MSLRKKSIFLTAKNGLFAGRNPKGGLKARREPSVIKNVHRWGIERAHNCQKKGVKRFPTEREEKCWGVQQKLLPYCYRKEKKPNSSRLHSRTSKDTKITNGKGDVSWGAKNYPISRRKKGGATYKSRAFTKMQNVLCNV